MEIVSNQFGQNFASDGVSKESTSAPVQPNQNVEVARNSNDSDEALGQQASQEPLELKRELRGRDNTTQGLSNNADISEREDKGESLSDAVQQVESFLQVQNRNLTFSIDEETSKSVVTVKDSESGDVIRQIPSEEVLKLAERIQELQQDVGSSVGVFINNEV